jgi:hypothetical protein
MVSAMSDDDKKATEGTGEKATNGADKATSPADEADTLKHIGGSESDAWNVYIASQALSSIRPYIGDEEKRDKMRAVVTAGLTGIAPRDELEAMIAAQMLACHDTAMGCFRDALNSKLHGRLWHEYLEQAGKLTRAGGQAVVGMVETPGGGAQPKSKDQAHGREIVSRRGLLIIEPVNAQQMPRRRSGRT